MAKLYRVDNFKGKLMRISFAFGLFKTREKTSDNGNVRHTYDSTLIAPVADFAPIRDAVQAAMVGAWAEKAGELFKAGLIHNPILAGDGKEARDKESGELNPGLGPDVCFVRVSSNKRPQVVGPDALTPITDENDLPSGSWGYPVLNAYAWSNDKGGKGVSVGILAFQLVKKAEGDEVLGGSGSVDTSKFFEKIDTGEAKPAAGAPKSADSLFG